MFKNLSEAGGAKRRNAQRAAKREITAIAATYRIVGITVLATILTFAATPFSLKADDGPMLAATINAYAEGGGTGGALNAVWNASTLTVTVTNTGGTPIIGATSGLTLDIDANITVLWTASLTAAITSGTLIDLIGSGKFQVEGGTLCNTITSGATRTIRNNHGTVEITSGTMEKMGNGIAIQNISTGNIESINQR